MRISRVFVVVAAVVVAGLFLGVASGALTPGGRGTYRGGMMGGSAHRGGMMGAGGVHPSGMVGGYGPAMGNYSTAHSCYNYMGNLTG